MKPRRYRDEPQTECLSRRFSYLNFPNNFDGGIPQPLWSLRYLSGLWAGANGDRIAGMNTHGVEVSNGGK